MLLPAGLEINAVLKFLSRLTLKARRRQKREIASCVQSPLHFPTNREGYRLETQNEDSVRT